jgi:uncharacterized protein (TIGR03437 family)
MSESIRCRFMKIPFALGTSITLIAGLAGAQGTIQTFAGNGSTGFAGDGGPATSAALNYPKGVALDTAGNLYIADIDNSRVRKVTAAGIISTVAGNGFFGYSGDGGPALAASISDVTGVAVDGSGNLYITDDSNRRIRKIGANGIISTIAGIGVQGFSGDGGPATSAMLGRPVALVLDPAGNLYFADSVNQRVRKINASGIITTVAGNGLDSYSGDGGPAVSASFAFPIGIAIDAAGNLYVADGNNNRVRLITPGGIISTFAGNNQEGFSGDGGSATSASLNIPSDVAVDAAGSIYIADAGNNRVRKVNASGTITTIAGTDDNGFSGDGGPATQAMLNYPWGLTTDASGGLYIADRVNDRIRFVSGGISAAPSLLNNDVLNGASLLTNSPIAPGAIVSIFGSNFSTGTVSASTEPLPTSLAGTSVTFNGVAAPLFYISPTLINAQAPFNMATGLVQVQVQRGSSVSAVSTSSAATFSPGIFIMNPATGQGAILNSNYSLVSPTAPAHGGEYVAIYTTGLGPVQIPVASGALAPSMAPFPVTVTLPIVTIGGLTAAVAYSGLAPASIGLYQVNVLVPIGLSAGNQPVQISIGGVVSNTATLAVAP